MFLFYSAPAAHRSVHPPIHKTDANKKNQDTLVRFLAFLSTKN